MVDGRFEHSDLFSRLATIERVATIEVALKSEKDTLKSEKGVDYTKLRDFLAAGKWKEANQETSIVILKAADCEEQKYLDVDSIEKIPYEDLYIIDQLWVKYSKGKFGFSVQKQIWSDCGGLPGFFTCEVYDDYCARVGWRKREGHNQDRISGVLDEDLTFELLDTTPKGHLPGDQPVFTWSGNSRRRLILLVHQIETPVTDKPAPLKSPPLKPKTKQKPQVELKSEKGVDYTKLRDLLAAGKWKKADQETDIVMCQAVGREKEEGLTVEDIKNFPCEDLRTIDQLWVKYSKGKFGFSVQKQIWLDCGGKPWASNREGKAYFRFCDRVGWRKDGEWVYDDLIFKLFGEYKDTTPAGHLPGRKYKNHIGSVYMLWKSYKYFDASYLMEFIFCCAANCGL